MCRPARRSARSSTPRPTTSSRPARRSPAAERGRRPGVRRMSNETRQAWEGVVALLSGQTIPLGPVTTDRYLGDPKRLCFFLSRYKFAGKMMKRCKRVIDIGCGDGIGTVSLISDTRAEVLGIDFDQPQIAYAQSTLVPA